jgi:hypothetical protein
MNHGVGRVVDWSVWQMKVRRLHAVLKRQIQDMDEGGVSDEKTRRQSNYGKNREHDYDRRRRVTVTKSTRENWKD